MTATIDILSAEQILELRGQYEAILARHDQNDAEKGLWAPLYEELYALVTDFDGINGPKPGVDYQSWLWLRGARYVNRGEGPFAALIRDYTIIQHQQRYGYPASDDEMNRASNEIAKNFLGQWLGYDPLFPGGTVPTIGQTGLFDAGPAASEVFNKEGGGDPAGWAGTLLFGNLGDRSFWDGLILTSLRDPNAVGHIGDGTRLPSTRDRGSYNAIAAAAALQEWNAASAAAGAILSPSEWAELVSIFWAQSAYHGIVDDLATDTNAAFQTYYGLTGSDVSPDLGSDTFGFWSTATDFLKDAHYVVGTVGNDVISTFPQNGSGAYVTDVGVFGWATGTGDVLNAGRGDDTVYGSTGNDILDGGDGKDTMSYARFGAITVTFKKKDSLAPLTAEVSKGVFNGFFSGRDLLYNFEKLIGSNEGDTFQGDISGLPAGFEFEVGDGNDTIDITGGAARTVVGGKGRDYIHVTAIGSVIYGDLKSSNGNADEGDSSANGDKIVFVPGVKFMDAGKYDQLVNITGTRLTGGVDSGQRANGAVIYNDKLLGGISYKQVGADLHIYDRFGAYLDQLSNKPIKGDFVVKNFDIANSLSGWGFAQFGIGQNSKLGLSFKTTSPLELALKKTFSTAGTDLLMAPFYYLLVGFSLIDQVFSVANSLLLNAKTTFWALGIDPLVIDLDGDGIETTSLGDSDVYFDVDGDRFAERTGWLGGDDGFLVLDSNHNGRVDDISEMFGNRFAGGLDELAQYDSNGDGKITAADLIWAELKVWQDANQDGITADGELKGLSGVGILEINLTRTALDVTTPQNAHLIGRGDVKFADGSIHRAFEAIFNSNDSVTKYAGETGAPTWATTTLNAKGFGSITDLAVAMANDADLGQLAATAAAAMTAPNLQTLVQQAGAVLGAWGSSLELTRELYAVRLSADGTTLLERQVWDGTALGAGWSLEQGWSPATRGPAAVLRDEAPYLTRIVDGRAVILDYGIRQADGSWKLASDPSVSYASKAAITALGHPAGTEWRVEEIGFNPYADLPVDTIGVRFTDGQVVDYTVQVTDADGTFFVWARNLDRALQLEWKTGDSREFALRNYAITFAELDEVNSSDDSTFRVELLTPAQFHFATSLGGIDFRPEMLSVRSIPATNDNNGACRGAALCCLAA